MCPVVGTVSSFFVFMTIFTGELYGLWEPDSV